MFITKIQTFTLTLFLYIALLTLVSAHEFAPPHRRDHESLKRMIKKRSPGPYPQDNSISDGLKGFLPNGNSDTNSTATSSSASQTGTSSDSASTSSTSVLSTSSTSTSDTASASSTSSSSSSESSTSQSSSSSSSSSSQSSSSSSSSTSSSTSSTTSTSSTSQTSQSPTATPSVTDNTSVPAAKQTTVTKTSTDAAATTSSSASVDSSNASSNTKTSTTVITVVIVLAASIGGLFILGFLFRKWKLGRSKKFDDRLQPIDWQPTNDDEGIIPSHRRANSGASSLRSAAHTEAGRGVPRYDVGSDHGHGSDRGSDHGHGASLAPVGGYADLARGSSPQPQMHELGRGPSVNRGYEGYNDGLARGPSMNRPYEQYEQYADGLARGNTMGQGNHDGSVARAPSGRAPTYHTNVPLHHQTGYNPAEAYDYNGNPVNF